MTYLPIIHFSKVQNDPMEEGIDNKCFSTEKNWMWTVKVQRSKISWIRSYILRFYFESLDWWKQGDQDSRIDQTEYEKWQVPLECQQNIYYILKKQQRESLFLSIFHTDEVEGLSPVTNSRQLGIKDCKMHHRWFIIYKLFSNNLFTESSSWNTDGKTLRTLVKVNENKILLQHLLV